MAWPNAGAWVASFQRSVPAVGTSRPANRCKRVLLPMPDEPQMARLSPLSTRSWISLRIGGGLWLDFASVLFLELLTQLLSPGLRIGETQMVGFYEHSCSLLDLRRPQVRCWA